jgi:hypothetical protein
MGVIPAEMHRASLDIVRKALAILKFIRLCILTYFSLLYSYLITSIRTGAPYRRGGSTLPVYIVFSASRLNPHDILTDLYKLRISLEHFTAA